MVLEMAKEVKTLEQRLLEVGERLASPPSSVDELYSLLDVIDSLVSRVEQSPSQSMLDALQPLMKALAVKDFLRHSDTDVKVAVASCISEITRITAPEAPYDDDIMKEIFQMIVGAFERLDDTSSRSYQKRVSILETVAKVRSCVVMLDLECDTLILQMFHHFLRTIRVDHPENVSSSMETIMTLVIEESEDISSELLSCLLDALKKDNKDVPPVAANLAEKVTTCCARKLKPYLLDSVQSTGALLNEYSKVVASICQENSDGLDHNGTPGSGELVVDDSKLSERTVSDELPQVSAKPEQEVGCPEKVSTAEDTPATAATSNGDAQIGNDDSMGQPSSPKIKSENSFRDAQSKSVEPDQADCVDPESTTGKPVSAVDLKKGKGRKTKSSLQLTDTTDRTDCDKDVSAATSRRKGRTKEAAGALQINDASAKEEEPTVLSEPERNECQQPLESDNPTSDKQIEPVEGPPNRSRTKKRMPPGPKAAGRRSDADTVAEPPASASEQKETIDDHEVHEEVMPSKGDDSEKEPDDADAVEAPMGLTSDSDVKVKRTTGKRGRYKRRKVMERETLGKKQKSNMKQQKEEDTPEKDVDGEPTLKEMASSPRSALKVPREDETHLDDSAKPKSRRKRSLDAEDAVVDKKELDERLVGSKIKVWWPDDKMFYEGVVDSYDPSTKMHTIVYTDGDVEVLLLKNERWESAGSDSEKDGDKEKAEGSASQMPRAKKSKANSNTTSKQVKSQQQSKSGTETSSKDVPRPRGRPRSKTNLGKLTYEDSAGSSKKSKDKPADDGKVVKTPRASGRLRDGPENDPEEESLRASSKQEESRNKSRDASSKASTAAKNDTSKVSGKSKDEPSKSSKRSKNDTPKSSARLKDDTPKSGSSKVEDDGDKLKDATPSRSEADEIKKDKTPRTKPKANSNPKTSGDLKANGIASKGKAKAGDSLSTAAVSDSEATTGGAGGRKRKRKGRK